MARTNLTKKKIKAPYNDANLTALHTKFAEHDTALDALETLVDAGMTASKRSVTINDEDAAVTGATCTIPLITGALPANAIVFAHELNIVEQFAGLSDVTIKVGGTDDDAIVASTDLDALVIGRYPGTLGAHPQGYFGGETLNVILTSAGGDLATLSAGQIIVTVWYFILA